MNIKETILSEIEVKGKEWNKITRAYYVYIRLGEILTFDPEFTYISNNEKISSIINENKNIDPECLKSNIVVCIGWAVIYSDILNTLKIKNKIKKDEDHDYVELEIDGLLIKSDPCYSRLSDINLIKEGIDTKGFTNINPHDKEKFYKCLTNSIEIINYHKGIKTIEVLDLVVTEIFKKSTEDNLTEEAMKAIQLIINCNPHKNRGYLDGVNYIKLLLDKFIGKEHSNSIYINDYCVVDKANSLERIERIYNFKIASGMVYYRYSINKENYFTLQIITEKEYIKI